MKIRTTKYFILVALVLVAAGSPGVALAEGEIFLPIVRTPIPQEVDEAVSIPPGLTPEELECFEAAGFPAWNDPKFPDAVTELIGIGPSVNGEDGWVYAEDSCEMYDHPVEYTVTVYYDLLTNGAVTEEIAYYKPQ